MSTYDSLATALAAALNTISNIGTVHALQRWSNNWADFLDISEATITSQDQIRFWMITRERVDAEPGEAFGLIRRTHRMVIIGALGVSDAATTYTTFQQLVDTVMDTVDKKRDLGVTSVLDYGVGPASVRTLAEEAVGVVFCHVCEIEVPVVTVHMIAYE